MAVGLRHGAAANVVNNYKHPILGTKKIINSFLYISVNTFLYI
jgi:hypothetical protein